jgi:hypothetical protein
MNVDRGLALGQHIMVFHNLGGIDLVIMDSLDCPIKGQGMYNAKTT